jgi:hypothetical protein
MTEQSITQQAPNAALTEDELNLVVGGSGYPSGDTDEDRKATPILL